MTPNIKLKQQYILRAIYKHKILSVDQIQKLFSIKSRITVSKHIQRLKEKKQIKMLKSPIGYFYFLTTKGSNLLGVSRVNEVKSIDKNHSDQEINLLIHLLKTNQIQKDDYQVFLDSYKTDRELKRIKFQELGGIAYKLRWVDLVVNTNKGKIAFEVETTRKNKDRYPEIINKLDRQFKEFNWTEINWLVYKKDVNWFTNIIMSCKPQSTMNLMVIENLKG